jgi:hypothetical protein
MTSDDLTSYEEGQLDAYNKVLDRLADYKRWARGDESREQYELLMDLIKVVEDFLEEVTGG